MEEIRLKNRPSYCYEDIVRLNKIDIGRITVRKIDFSNCSIFLTRYMTETGEKLLRICVNNACGEFLKSDSHLPKKFVLFASMKTL